MKSYNQYQNNLNELYMKEYNLLSEETQQKIVEWNQLDIESQQKIVEGLQNGDEEIISEWGEINEWLGRAARLVGKLPGIRTVTGLGLAGYRAAKGDWTGAGLAAGSAIPGPVGWGFVAADVARGLAKGGNKSKTPGQPGGATPGQTGGTKPKTKPPITISPDSRKKSAFEQGRSLATTGAAKRVGGEPKNTTQSPNPDASKPFTKDTRNQWRATSPASASPVPRDKPAPAVKRVDGVMPDKTDVLQKRYKVGYYGDKIRRAAKAGQIKPEKRKVEK